MNLDHDLSAKIFLESLKNGLNPKTLLSALYTTRLREHLATVNNSGGRLVEGQARQIKFNLKPPVLATNINSGGTHVEEVLLNNLPNRQFDYIDYGKLTELDRGKASDTFNTSIKGVEYRMSMFMPLFFSSIERLGSDGVLVFQSSEKILSKNYGISPILQERDKGIKILAIKDLLETKGLYINAVLGLPKNISGMSKLSSGRRQNIQNCIFILSRKKTQLLFVAIINDENYFLTTLINFLKVKEELCTATKDSELNLETGCLVNKDELNTFSTLNAKVQINEYRQHYKEYKIVTFGDLIVNFSEKINYDVDSKDLFIKKEDYLEINIAQSNKEDILNYFGSEPRALIGVYVLTINNDVINRYLEIFFQSKLGESVYQSHLSIRRFNYFLSKENLKKIPIFIPSIEKQKQIISAYDKVNNLQSSIKTHRETLALNPSEFITESMEKVDDMLEIVGKLNIADKIRGLVRKGESDILEYKETLSWDVDQNKVKHKVLETTTLKNIVGFINNRGGMLLIGVTDSQKITGIDFEIKKLHGNSVDDFLLHFKNLIKDRIGTNFYEYIPEYDVHSVGGKLVLLIRCLPTPKSPGCYLDGKDFYVRRNPGTDKLDGPKLVEYTNSHFSSG